jgi:hypothetical protein
LNPIEQRWRTRFGTREIDGLRESLHTIVAQTEFELPEGLVEVREMTKPFPAKVTPNTSHLSLPALQSRTLLIFALEFEPQSAAPLALCANGLRVLGEKPIREKDIPLLTGGSAEVTGIGWQLKPYIVVEPDLNAKRGKIVRLNARGLQAHGDYQHLLHKIEKSWVLRFGREKIHALRSSLLSLFDQG